MTTNGTPVIPGVQMQPTVRPLSREELLVMQQVNAVLGQLNLEQATGVLVNLLIRATQTTPVTRSAFLHTLGVVWDVLEAGKQLAELHAAEATAKKDGGA